MTPVHQLSRHWEGEFRLCTLLANSAVVHADETGWSIHSVWAFLSEKVRVLFFGVHKDADTLQAISRSGDIRWDRHQRRRGGVRKFHHSQNAGPLLRKAIKLTLVEPTNAEFRGSPIGCWRFIVPPAACSATGG